MNFHCPKCQVVNLTPAKFCNNCGVQFAFEPPPVQPIKKSNNTNTLIIIVIILGLCGFCALIGKLGEQRESVNANQVALINGQQNQNTTPTAPPNFAELKTKGEKLLKFERSEYQQSDLAQFDEVMQPLRAIPKEDKNYKEAQSLSKKLIDKTAPIMAEIIVLGEKPSEIDLKLAFNHYLRTRLNDYDSSEYVNYTAAHKIYVKKEPFWVSVLSLRAKNAFGGYILKDVTMYIRNKEVVLADGL